MGRNNSIFSFAPSKVGFHVNGHIYIYIYIIGSHIIYPMRNHNNEFILIIYIARSRMANIECQQLEIQLEFVR